MPPHFTPEEFAARRTAACAALADAGHDGLVLFRQESMYYLSGYDSFGYVYFQAMLLTADGRMALLTRAPDRLQAKFTSILEDIRIWRDAEDADPMDDFAALLGDCGLTGGRLGVEWNAYGLPAALGFRVAAALERLGCETVDASLLISRLRLIKSPAELDCVRRAARLADDALDAAVAATRAGADEGDILADLQAAIYRGGGDDPANEQIIGSGPGALMCRYYSGRRRLDAQDQLTLEFAAAWRHYHAAMMRTITIGPPDPRLVRMHEASVAALTAARDALKPGRPIGEVFDAHATVLDAFGHQDARMNACGYAMGATFAPNWMDWPMFFHGNPVIAAPGMTFFIHIIIFDEPNGLAMSNGHAVEVTDGGAVPLSKRSVDLIRR